VDLVVMDRIRRELLSEAATCLAWADQTARDYPWRRHDVRIFAERGQTAIAALELIEAALGQ
jgi:hypothetical protein